MVRRQAESGDGGGGSDSSNRRRIAKKYEARESHEPESPAASASSCVYSNHTSIKLITGFMAFPKCNCKLELDSQQTQRINHRGKLHH